MTTYVITGASDGRSRRCERTEEDDAMSVEECAGLIVRAMNKRQREVVMTSAARIGRFAKLIAPGLIDQVALSKLKDEARPS